MADEEQFAITNIMRQNNLPLSEAQVASLAEYESLLREWNGRINLISRRDQENIWTAHILHSLSILFHLEIPASVRVLDLGSGGGLPGIPLAIARPDLTVVLLDSMAKKMRAVSDIVARLKLGDIDMAKAVGIPLDIFMKRRFGAITEDEDACALDAQYPRAHLPRFLRGG